MKGKRALSTFQNRFQVWISITAWNLSYLWCLTSFTSPSPCLHLKLFVVEHFLLNVLMVKRYRSNLNFQMFYENLMLHLSLTQFRVRLKALSNASYFWHGNSKPRACRQWLWLMHILHAVEWKLFVWETWQSLWNWSTCTSQTCITNRPILLMLFGVGIVQILDITAFQLPSNTPPKYDHNASRVLI